MSGEWRAMFTYLRDRLGVVLTFMGITLIYIALMLMEHKLNQGYVHSSTIGYFILLAFVIGFGWLTFDYWRQRTYLKALIAAGEQMHRLEDSLSLDSVVTQEQQLVAKLLQRTHAVYLNELGNYRRQQERHNHFVLQWVHHMKTPVSVIDLLTQESTREQEQDEATLISIREENDRLARGLEMMLYTARLEKFEIDLYIEKAALHEIARAAINANKQLCIQHAIFPRIEGEAWVNTDVKWMTFVLNQLISNAVKYSKTKESARQLLITLRKEAGSDTMTVSDRGVGIAPHDLRRIFDPFFTGDNGRTEGESTGMGLYLVKQVCEKLGHAIQVNSQVGEGTDVTITYKTAGLHQLHE